MIAIVVHLCGSLICTGFHEEDSQTPVRSDADMTSADSRAPQAGKTCIREWVVGKSRDKVNVTA
jgi:hypothetical protein